jgi:hypothetical protein
MSIFEPVGSNLWRPSPLAAGPFSGLQGGAVAGLLTADLEARAEERGWGRAVSASTWFLRPVPMADLRTSMTSLVEGGRVSVIENALHAVDAEMPCATVRVTFARERTVAIPPLPGEAGQTFEPERYPARTVNAAHGRSWFMDAMEARWGDGVAWFRLKHEIVAGAGPLARVLGPADWTHGIARPLQDVCADPNPNLTVHLFRAPVGCWIGVRAHADWQPAQGIGMGRGVLLDTSGEIGCVSMSVVLLPMPR